jgi:hypothetical protein
VTATDDLPAEIVDYLLRRDAARQNRAAEVFGRLTERERLLVKEAAVMGYVQGRMHPADADHPKDSEVVFRVVDGCLSNSDLYPTLTGRTDDEDEEPSDDRA